MLQLSKHGNPQILVLIGVQTNAKMPKGHFYQRFSMHEQTLYDKKCMNVMKCALNTWLDAT